MTVSPFSALVLFLCRLSLCSAFGALTSPALKASAAEPQAQSERTTAHCTTTNASQPWALRTEAIDGCGSNKPLHRVFRSRHDFSAEWRLGGYGTGYHLGVGRMLLKVAERNAYPQPIDIQLICHKGMEESSDVQPLLGLNFTGTMTMTMNHLHVHLASGQILVYTMQLTLVFRSQ